MQLLLFLVDYMFQFIGSRKPHRHDIIDKEFAVRLMVQAKPETQELSRRWLQRHLGPHNYASKPQVLWAGKRALCGYFRTVHDVARFLVRCPHISLIAERYDHFER